jgi:hypothetical protein
MPIYPDHVILLLPGQEKPFTFNVLYKSETYLFAECPDNPALRGFFTRPFVEANKWIPPGAKPFIHFREKIN